MSNLIFGLQSGTRSLSILIRSLIEYQLFWGFILGFLVSTGVYGFIITENPKQMATMLLYDQSKSFEKMYTKSASGAYTVSYMAHARTVNRLKFITMLFGVTFIIMVTIALLRY